MIEMVSGQHIGNIYRLILSTTGNVFHILLTLLFMLITLLFVYKDGHRMVGQLDILGERVLPQRWQHFSRVIPATISATVTGMGLIAIGEGVVLGVAYWIADVPSPVLLGVITAVMAMIPGGAPLSFTLVSLYLVGSGEPLTGAALFAWGSIELFIVDKTLRPDSWADRSNCRFYRRFWFGGWRHDNGFCRTVYWPGFDGPDRRIVAGVGI